MPALTLFEGKTYQFPLYEIASWCATLTWLSAVHYFRDDYGEMRPARQVMQMRVGPGLKTWFRFFAMLGLCQVGFFICYNVPYFCWSTKGTAYPPYAAYRVAGVCGPGTHYDCPGLTVPLPKADSPTNCVAP